MACTVNEVVLAFMEHADGYYCHADGTPTGETENFKAAMRPLTRLYGWTPARNFGPLALKAVRSAMIDGGLARTTINGRIGKSRPSLRLGGRERTGARERPPRAEGGSRAEERPIGRAGGLEGPASPRRARGRDPAARVPADLGDDRASATHRHAAGRGRDDADP